MPLSFTLPLSRLLSRQQRGESSAVGWRQSAQRGSERCYGVGLLGFAVDGATSSATGLLSWRNFFIVNTCDGRPLARQAGGHWFKSSSAHFHKSFAECDLHTFRRSEVRH